MSRYITVTDTNPSGLVQHVWRFWFCPDRNALILDSYTEQERPSRRHGWKNYGRSYSRLLAGPGPGIAEADVPMPKYITDRAMTQLTAGISVRKWEGGR